MSPSYFLGALGMTGLTAYVGMLDIGRPKPGETVVVSAAAGAVGSVAGQLAKIQGARVVGIAGGPEKCALLTGELGFDAAVDYKAPDWRDQLKAATPDGIDVDFENVGGEIMEAVFGRLNVRARVALCGLISGYNDDAPAVSAGPRNFGNLLIQRVHLEGFIVLDHFGRAREIVPQLAGWMAEGKLKAQETVVEGFEQLPRGDQHAVRRREHRQARREALNRSEEISRRLTTSGSGRLSLRGCRRWHIPAQQMALEEVRLIGHRALEPLAEVDVEVADRVALDLRARRLAGGLEYESGRRQGVVIGNAEQDWAADPPSLATGAVAADMQRDARRDFVAHRGVRRRNRLHAGL